MAKVRQEFEFDDSGLLEALKQISRAAEDADQAFNNMQGTSDEMTKGLKKDLDGSKKSIDGYNKEVEQKSKTEEENIQTGKEWQSSLKDSASNVTILGVNVGSLITKLQGYKTVMLGATGATKGFSSGLKAMRVALISTGIGAVVVALGALITYFTRSQRGIDKLNVALAGLRAVFDVLIDTVADFGESIYKAVNDPKKGIVDMGKSVVTNIINRFKGAIEAVGSFGIILERLANRDLKGAKEAAVQGFNAITKAISGSEGGTEDWWEKLKETNAAARELEKRTQALTLAQRALKVEEAEVGQQIEKTREESRKSGITQQESIELIEKASRLEGELAAKRQIVFAEEFAITHEINQLADSKNKDLDKEADLKVKLIGIETTRARSNRRLEGELRALRNKGGAEAAARAKQIEAQLEAEKARVDSLKESYIDLIQSIEDKLQAQKLSGLEGRALLAEQARMAEAEIDLLEKRAIALAESTEQEYNLAEKFLQLRKGITEEFAREVRALEGITEPLKAAEKNVNEAGQRAAE